MHMLSYTEVIEEQKKPSVITSLSEHCGWLEAWLKRYDGILLLVSHDRDFLDALCTRIAHIEQKQIRLYTGNYSDFEHQRAE